VRVHPDSEQVVLVTFSGFGSGRVFRSSNGGSTWQDISGNLPDTPVNDVIFYHPGVPTSTLLVATDVGVFISNTYGATWQELADGLPNTVAIHLDYNELGNKLRIGTHGRGVYETTIVTGVIDVVNNAPSQFRLMQNYPNPFNPSTNIRVEVADLARVTLKVYDVLGQLVATLFDGEKERGTYTLTWDAGGASSGIYYCRMSTGSFTQTVKMIVTK
jgi:hypothetical protein